MNVSVNAKPMLLEKPITIEQLLKTLGYQGNFFVVAINQDCLARQEYGEREISDGDEIEILSAQAGG